MKVLSWDVQKCPNSHPSHGRGRRFEPCTAHQNHSTACSALLGAFFWAPVLASRGQQHRAQRVAGQWSCLGRQRRQRIQRALNTAHPLADVGVNHGGADIGVAQQGDEFEQLRAWHIGSHQTRLPASSTPSTAKTSFARSMPTDTMAMDFTFQQTSELMSVRTCHRGTLLPHPANARSTWDGEVPFIR